jgi:hypothetical protein
MSNLRLDTAASSAHGTTGLINLTSTSRTLAQSSPPGNNRPLTSNTVATKAPPVPASSKASEGVTAAQQQLWASLKLDPLLIQHATGLHRVLHDVQTLSQQFQSFANHLLAMSKTGASLTNHLQKLYRQDSVPDSVRSLAAAHHSMQQSSVDWFSSKFKNEIMNLFADWEEDASDVLSQLGLVQVSDSASILGTPPEMEC